MAEKTRYFKPSILDTKYQFEHAIQTLDESRKILENYIKDDFIHKIIDVVDQYNFYLKPELDHYIKEAGLNEKENS